MVLLYNDISYARGHATGNLMRLGKYFDKNEVVFFSKSNLATIILKDLTKNNGLRSLRLSYY